MYISIRFCRESFFSLPIPTREWSCFCIKITKRYWRTPKAFTETKTFPNPKLPKAGRDAIASMEFKTVADCVRTAINPVTPRRSAAISQYGSIGMTRRTSFSKERMSTSSTVTVKFSIRNHPNTITIYVFFDACVFFRFNISLIAESEVC